MDLQVHRLLLLLGFPIAVILAWAFELTPEGVKRTEDAAPGELTQIIEAPASTRWPAGLLALAGVMALLAGAWYVGRQSASDPGGEGGNPDARATRDGAAPVSDRGASLAYVDAADGTRPKIAVLPFVDMSQAGRPGVLQRRDHGRNPQRVEQDRGPAGHGPHLGLRLQGNEPGPARSGTRAGC